MARDTGAGGSWGSDDMDETEDIGTGGGTGRGTGRSGGVGSPTGADLEDDTGEMPSGTTFTIDEDDEGTTRRSDDLDEL